jgi:hypothetical protein
MLKEMGIAYVFQDRDLPNEPVLPRIIIKRPRPGYLHALEKSDVFQILKFVGAEAIYGLRSIELVEQPAATVTRVPFFGRLIVPGRIKLYEQPTPPWRLPGILPETEAKNIRRAGAEVEIDLEVEATFVHWPEDSLRNFMIFEVLLHEVGHHILQHNTGKRTQRIVRTRDHEAFARRFAHRCRSAWFEEETIG